MAPLGQIHVRGRPLGDGVAPLIITPLIGRTPQALADELKVILPKRPDMLEWRVDHFDDLGDGPRVVAAAREVRRAAGALPLLLTRRHHREGGQPIAID